MSQLIYVFIISFLFHINISIFYLLRVTKLSLLQAEEVPNRRKVSELIRVEELLEELLGTVERHHENSHLYTANTSSGQSKLYLKGIS